MNISKLNITFRVPEFSSIYSWVRNYQVLLLFGLLIFLWPVLSQILITENPQLGFIDPNIWLLLLLSIIVFLAIIGLCYWLLQWAWMRIGLPGLRIMVSQFYQLELWQQLSFFSAFFALLLLTAVGTLNAII